MIVSLSVLYAHFRNSEISSFKSSLMSPDVSKTSVIVMAPWSIISTLMAVVLKVWWSSFDQTFRRLEPYLAMTQGPISTSKGTGLSYINYLSFWVVGKAVWNRHFRIVLVATVAMLCEIREYSLSLY